MGFFKRIARGWRLMSYCFMSIYKEQPKLITAALLMCAVPVLLFFMGALVLGQFAHFTQWLGWSTLDVSQLRVPEHINVYMLLGGVTVGLLVVFAYILYIALLYFLKAFLQDQHVSFKIAVKAVLPSMPFILVWIVLDMLGRKLLFRAVAPLVYTVFYAFWAWLSFLVIPVLALEKTSILNALRTSVTVALKTLADIVGASLWMLCVVLVPGTLVATSVVWLTSQVNLLATTSAGLAFALLGIYFFGVFLVMLAFANVLFTVALYLLNTGQSAPQVPARIRALYPEQTAFDIVDINNSNDQFS